MITWIAYLLGNIVVYAAIALVPKYYKKKADK